MAKFYGSIGYAETLETSPGVWEEQITERNYYGDVMQTSRRLQNSNGVNDNVVITNNISILSDPFANENFQSMRYVEYMGAKWKVSNVEIQYPRLILTLGELYNEN